MKLTLAFKSHHKNPPSMAGTDYVPLKSSDLLLCCSALTDLHKSTSCFHGKCWGLELGLGLMLRKVRAHSRKEHVRCPHGRKETELSFSFLILLDYSWHAETVVPSHQELDSSFPEAWTRNCHASALPGHCSETCKDIDEDTDVQ